MNLKYGMLAIFLVLAITGCQLNGELKPVSQIQPGVAKEGTLANEKLIADTMASLQTIQSNPSNSKVIKFIVQHPVGSPGSRSWREIWIVDPEGEPAQYIITFSESGSSAADFRIQKM